MSSSRRSPPPGVAGPTVERAAPTARPGAAAATGVSDGAFEVTVIPIEIAGAGVLGANGGAGIDHDVIFHDWMARVVLGQPA
jgi:hypothetical protein